MSAIITPELVRRYLKATGQPASGGESLALEHGIGVGIVVSLAAESRGTTRDELIARLGMLAAAEDLLERSREYFAAGDTLLGTSKAADGMRLVAMAGIDPKA